jgi:hypothetical protein
MNDNYTERYRLQRFLDITVFCCGAVGGDLQQASKVSTSVENNTIQSDQDTFEPICVTSNYRDSECDSLRRLRIHCLTTPSSVLDCYKVTALDSCSSTDVAPWGICNPQLADTSRTMSDNSSSQATRASSHHKALLLLLLLPILNAMIS